jgi:hypothetical protein
MSNIGTISSGAITATSNGNNQIHLKGTDTNPTAILMDYNGTGSTDRIRIYNNAGGFQFLTENGDEKLSIAKTTGNATFAGVIGIGGTSTNSSYGVYLQNNKWYATQFSSAHDVVRMNANTSGGLDIYNQTDSGFTNVRAGSYNIGSTTVIDASRNLTNIGTITQTTNGEILDASANLTNINNIYASGYRIGSTTVIDSSRNLTNIGTISSGAITSTGNITTSQHIQLGSGYNLSWGGTYGANKPTIAGAGGFIAFYPTGATDGEVIKIDADGIDMNSHNLTEVGTISSGVITSTGATFSSTIEVDASGTFAIKDLGSVGWAYSPQESGAAGSRYFLLFNYDNNASYPYLTNRTQSGRVSIYAGTAAGGGENEKIRVNGGDGTTDVTFYNSQLNIGAVTSDASSFLSGSQRIVSNGYIATNAIYNYGETGGSPAAIVFGNGSTYGEDQISLITSGVTALYIDSSQNITVAGTVDGRDLASDGSKLDGIAAGATNTAAPYYTSAITSSNVTTALGYTPYQENTALSATTGVFSSTVNIDRELRLDARYDGGDGDNVLAFKDSSGNYSIRQNVNDGNGNYSISIGYSGVGSGQYAVTGDGVGKILFGGHGRDGAVSINSAPTGTAGNNISFSIGLLVDGSDNTIRVGTSANGTGMDTAAGTKVFDASANAFATSYSVGVNEVISSTRVGTFPSINLDDQIISTGDTNTYMQFHAADQWRVVTGGSERLQVNNTSTTINNGYLQITGSDSHLVATTTATASTVRIGKTASTRSAIVFDTSSTGTTGSARIYTIENAAGDRLRIGNPDHPEALAINSSGNVTFAGNISAGPMHILGATGGDKLDYASHFEANGANIQLTLERTGSGWGGIGASGNNAFMVYSSDIGLRFGVTQAGSLLANGGTEFLTAARNLVNIASANIGGGTSYFSEKLLVSGRTRVAGQLDIALGSGYSNYGTLNHDDANFTIGVTRVAGTGNINLAPYGNVNIASAGLQINGTTVIDSSRQLTNISAIIGLQTLNVGRGDVYFENNSNSNADGAGITLRTGTNPSTGSIFDVRSSGQACRFFSGQSITTAGINPFYVGAPSTGAESTAANYAILLNTNGDITAEGNVTAYGSVSDIRQKENIEQIDKPIERLEKIKGITFNYKKKTEDERLMGVIAQDLLEDDILKLAVYEQEDFKAEDDDPLKHTYGVRYEHLTAILIEAIKDQQKDIEKLKEEVSSLRSKI